MITRITRDNASIRFLRKNSIEPSIRFQTGNGYTVHLTLSAWELKSQYGAKFGRVLITPSNEKLIVIGACQKHLWFKHPTLNILVNDTRVPFYQATLLLKEELDIKQLRAFFFDASNFQELVDITNISKYQFNFAFPIAEKEKKIGMGSTANVYKKEFDGKVIACKVIERKGKKGYSQELRIMTYMTDILPKNDFLLKFYGFSPLANQEQLRLEYVDGGELINFIDKDERYHLSTCLSIILQIAKGLELLKIYSIVHCDIKSGNILVSKAGDAKLADFGMSRLESELEGTGIVRGTLEYLAPEIISYFVGYDPLGTKNKVENQPPLTNTHKADIYAFGLVIWEILTREKLFGKVHDTWNFHTYVKNPENLPTHSITASDPAPQQKMASLYKWCCLFDHTQRPTATDLVQECELGEVISDKLRDSPS